MITGMARVDRGGLMPFRGDAISSLISALLNTKHRRRINVKNFDYSSRKLTRYEIGNERRRESGRGVFRKIASYRHRSTICALFRMNKFGPSRVTRTLSIMIIIYAFIFLIPLLGVFLVTSDADVALHRDFYLQLYTIFIFS